MYEVEKIKEYYKEQAEKFKTDGKSTMADPNTRNLEIRAMLKYLKDNQKVLEVGCGNGYATIKIMQNKDVDLTAIDFSKELIEQARKQKKRDIEGKIKFLVGDVLNLKLEDGTFDTVFTIRCLINITDWEYQKKALMEIYRVLKKGGLFIMLESFTDGLDNMNKARKELGLYEVPQPFHNLYFDKEKVINFLKGKLKFIKEDNFLSTYYFGSRVLYPALLGKNKEPEYDSLLNSFFASMPSYGDHAAIKILIFEKI